MVEQTTLPSTERAKPEVTTQTAADTVEVTDAVTKSVTEEETAPSTVATDMETDITEAEEAVTEIDAPTTEAPVTDDLPTEDADVDTEDPLRVQQLHLITGVAQAREWSLYHTNHQKPTMFKNLKIRDKQQSSTSEFRDHLQELPAHLTDWETMMSGSLHLLTPTP